MRKFTTIVLILTVLATFLAVAAFAEEAAHTYVGEAKCKTCHKDVYTAWSESKHAKAFSLLSDEEKKDEKCIACHTTGKDAEGVLIENVTCEVCHGAGSDYKSTTIMSKKKWAADPETHKKMAIDAGLVYPEEKTCVKCHTKEGNPNYKEFKFAEKKDKVHPVAAAE